MTKHISKQIIKCYKIVLFLSILLLIIIIIGNTTSSLLILSLLKLMPIINNCNFKIKTVVILNSFL